MRRALNLFFVIAVMLFAASCVKDVIGIKVVKNADITLAVSLGADTKAFADGTTVDKLYAGLYEITDSDKFVWVADNSAEPVSINGKAATVSFPGKLQGGQSYRVVFWAQKEGAPYSIDWAAAATSGPVVTAAPTGAANDESRDAFYGYFDTGVVTGNVDKTDTPISLKRPFAQVNVLVSKDNFNDPTAAVSSSMTVAQAPTVLNLATKATSVPADWTFSEAVIAEPAFGTYADAYRYVAMNYVLVDQLINDPRYDVVFSVVTAAAAPQTAKDRQVKNAPFRPNGRTNIVGNVFNGNFNVSVPSIINPNFDSEETVTIEIDDDQNPPQDPPQKENQTLSFANATEEVTLGDNYTLQAVSGAKTAVSYTSSNADVATINGTTVTLVGEGETTITATAEEDETYNSATASYTLTVNAPMLPDFTTVAELKALLSAESDSFTGTLTDAVVSFVAGTSDAVIKDASASILYHKETGHGLLQGQTISGDVIVEAVIYNGINEITDLAATVEGAGSAVEPEVVTLVQLAANYAAYESAYVKVVGVTSQTTTTTKGNITGRQDATDYVIYTNVAIPVNAGDIFTAEGTVTRYNITEQLKVWKAADLTVTTPAPVLSASPKTTTVAAATTSVTWNITSNTDWTITPGEGVTPSTTSGNGNAEVTLSFAANEGSSAATYTATVSAEGCEDVTITITQNGTGSSSTITDELTASLFAATSTTYADFSNVAATSSARYAGNSAKSSSGGIQFRSKNSNSGIVSTTSGGRVKSVTITIESGSNSIDVYGSNTAYNSAADLYATGEGGNQGTKIGTLNATGTITFTDDYAYIGIRSNNGAIYISKIEIEWE